MLAGKKITLREYLKNPFALDPMVSLYLVSNNPGRQPTLFTNDAVPFMGNEHSSSQINFDFTLVKSSLKTVVVTKTDQDPPNGIPDLISRFFHNNCTSLVEGNLHALPMGRDFRARKAAEKIKIQDMGEKAKTLYVNFSCSTHESRESAFSQLAELKFTSCAHGGEFMKYPISH